MPIEPLMTQETTVARRQIEITNGMGLHMRPAGKFVKVAVEYQSEVHVLYNGKQFNGKSILDLINLAVPCGTRIEIEARGADAERAVEALVQLVSAGFYEDANGDAVEAPDPTAAEPPR